MKKTLFSAMIAAAAVCGVCGTLGAATLDPSEALRRALASSSGPGNSVSAIAGVSPSLSHTESMPSSGRPALYVFNNPGEGGFLVVSADDCAPALLGYSASGSFDWQTAPENMKWWLEEYGRQIEWSADRTDVLAEDTADSAEAVGLPGNGPAPLRSERTEIAPLVETTWNQDSPYNLLCPEYSGEKSVTGCVATAMAQIANFHKWPQGTGNGSYTYTYRGKEISFDFGENTFDWEAMLPSYDSDAGSDSRMAVAKLMFACGVAVTMQYSSMVSNAFSEAISRAFDEFLGYDPAVSLAMRDYYTESDWTDLIYSELAARRPVLYSGSGGNGGHAFVCDGYDSGGYFHINWGWGGYCDGNYLLSALNPTDVGIGGGAGEYNTHQDAVIGIGRPGDVTDFTPVCPVHVTGGFSYDSARQQGSEIMIQFKISDNQGIYNYSAYSLSGTLGTLIVSDSGEEIGYYGVAGAGFPPINLLTGQIQGYLGYGCYIPVISTPGTYYLYPAFRDREETVHRLKVIATSPQMVVMTVAPDGNVTFSEGEPLVRNTLRVSSLRPSKEYVVRNEPTTFFIDCTNGAVPFNGMLTLKARPAGDLDEAGSVTSVVSLSLSLGAGQESGFMFDCSVSLPSGMYEFFFTDASGDPVSPYFPIEVKDLVPATSLTLEPSAVEAVVDEEFRITATILPENVTEKRLFWSSTDEDVAVVDDSGYVIIVGEGNARIIAETLDGSDLMAECAVSVVSGLDLVMSDSSSVWDVTTPSGVVVRRGLAASYLLSLRPGLYILRSGSRAVKVVIP